jgi:hypothetical protein
MPSSISILRGGKAVMRSKFIFPIGVFGILFTMLSFGFRQPILSLDSTPAVVLYPSSVAAGLQQEWVDYLVSRIYLPVVFRPPRDHFYAQGIRQGSNYYGVWANITTADPKIREVLFSYASINIISSDGHWIEVGWIKSPIRGCVPKFI